MRPITGKVLCLTALALVSHACVAQPERPAMAEFDLTGSRWLVEDIGGAGVIDSSHTTIEFIQAGQAAGDSGCNRWSGGFTQDGPSLSFGPMAGTQRACAAGLMNQETNFYKAMARVSGWEVQGTGLLHLVDASGATVIRAAPLHE